MNPESIARIGSFILCSMALTGLILAEDWPEWRGKGRRGVWQEGDILQQFPENGLDYRWRTPVAAGFSGPAVSGGRVFVTDFRETPGSRTMDGIERVVCLDEKTGQILWTREWQTSYRRLMASYATGPRATPTVDGDRVYLLGATGRLQCLKTTNGQLIWEKDFVRDYGTSVPIWGISSAPLVHGDRLFCLVGGEPDARVVAFDKRNGREIWRAISSDWEMGYAQPLLIEAGGTSQLIIWHARALTALNPDTGQLFWEIPFEVPSALTVATPVQSGDHLFVSQFYRGSMMVQLHAQEPSAKLLWKAGGSSEMPESTQGLHALITTPVLEGEHIYGVCSYGQFRCLEAATGDRTWETLDMTELARWASAFIVRNGTRYFINNDKGELIIARFSPQGYEEIDRTHLIKPTSNSVWGRRPGQRKAGDRIVNWSHPAYANQHVFARNDKEIVCASLAAK